LTKPQVTAAARTFIVTLNAVSFGYWMHSAWAGVFMWTLPAVVCYVLEWRE
jgi:hypothetical protein